MDNSLMVTKLNFQNTYIESLINLTKFRINNKSHYDEITSFSFMMKVYDFYRRVLGLKEYQFSTQALNASRDYYAMVKNTKTKIGDDKLKSLLVNTRALVEHLRETGADSELVQLYIKEANLYIQDIEVYFLNIEKSRLNKRLVKNMKTLDVVWMV